MGTTLPLKGGAFPIDWNGPKGGLSVLSLGTTTFARVDARPSHVQGGDICARRTGERRRKGRGDMDVEGVSPREEGTRSRSRSRSPPRRSGWRECGKGFVQQLEEVLVRGGLREEDLEEEVLVQLVELREEESEHVMQSFTECELDKIKNPSRFLAGIIRRVRKHGMLAKEGLDALRGPVRDKCESLIQQGKLREEDLTRRVCEVLTDARERDALQGLESYASSDTDSIRSKSGYILGIMRRVQGDDRRPRVPSAMAQPPYPGAAFVMPYGSLGIYSAMPAYPGLVPYGYGAPPPMAYDRRDGRSRHRRDEGSRRPSRREERRRSPPSPRRDAYE